MSSHRRWTLLVIPALVATALTTVLTSPAAAAVPGRETITRVTTSDSTDDKWIDVSCTGDRWLLSAGVSIESDGRAFVVVDNLVPALDTVNAYAHEYEYGTTATWALRVWAVCADRAGTHRTSSRMTTSDSDNKGVVVDCPDDLVVTGVGWEIEGGPGEVLVEAAIPTANTVTVNAYEVDAGGSGGYGLSWTVRAYATCVTRPAGHAVLDDVTPSTSAAKAGRADCTDDKVELGAGFYLPGPRGRINTTSLVPGFDAALTYAHEVVPTTNSWTMTSYVICANR
jgi:hypothetical protein